MPAPIANCSRACERRGAVSGVLERRAETVGVLMALLASEVTRYAVFATTSIRHPRMRIGVPVPLVLQVTVIRYATPATPPATVYVIALPMATLRPRTVMAAALTAMLPMVKTDASSATVGVPVIVSDDCRMSCRSIDTGTFSPTAFTYRCGKVIVVMRSHPDLKSAGRISRKIETPNRLRREVEASVSVCGKL